MQIDSKGYVITAALSSIRRITCGEIWLITRVNKNIPGVKWVPELAPDRDLYNKYLNDWKGKPGQEWWPEYKKEFELQLQSETRLRALREVWSLVNSGQVIALLCYCAEDTYCHRSIVAEFLRNYDVKVEELVKEIPKKDEDVSQLLLF